MPETIIDKLSTDIQLPQAVAMPRFRKPKKNIPQTKIQRDFVLARVKEFVNEIKPVPPVPIKDLRVIAERFIKETETDPLYTDYCGILINNEVWRETLSAIPYERRLLLLPKCLRVEEKCPAPFDEFGLLCKQCGLCSIQDFQNEAERLGYAVLVAEGSAIVMSLIQTGKIEAIVGVSCISVLERAFPYMEAAAIPGIAIPLLQDDCINVTVDSDWVWDVVHLNHDDKTRRLDLNALREEIDSWFAMDALQQYMGEAEGETERIARQWLNAGGKRWRPFLSVATYQALTGDDLKTESDLPEGLKKVAISVECFHKASLIHDDIVDGDAERYGRKTLHEEHGKAVALNVGDLLIGEGYRLLSEVDIDSQLKIQMINIASEGQRELCRGQGAELEWSEDPYPLSSKQVLGIFKQKTAPAFEVALKLGACFSQRYNEVVDVLEQYSEALGIAYQILDDLDDMNEDAGENRFGSIRPSLILATARERSRDADKQMMESLWRNSNNGHHAQDVHDIIVRSKSDQRALRLLENYKEAAIRSLQELENANLKGLLRRIMGKIFNDLEIKGWCKEEAAD
ncbi:MAG: polyprenyl synthetase family protein [Verrucomicrobiota bacterium]